MITLKLSSREKRIALFSMGILGIAAVYNMVVEPTVVSLKGTREKAAVLNNELLKLNRILEMQGTVESTYLEYKEAIVIKNSQEEEIADLLREIESLSRPLFIEIISIKPLPIIDKGFYQRYLIQVEAEGNTIDICNFLYSIEHSASLMRIKRIQFNARSDDIVRISFQVNRVLVKE
jgi:hypothetical protein